MIPENIQEKFDVAVVGTGMGSLTTACLLARDGYKVAAFEQNYLPGGCTSSYWRKGFVFESGATTLVGLDQDMPLKYVLDELSIKIDPIHLSLPMQVHLKSGKILNRHESLNQWIEEAEQVFGKKNQRAFWEFCYKISQFVWQTSLKQRSFPPRTISDLWQCALNSNLSQFKYAGYSFYSTQWLLKKYDLLENAEFVDFVNEQLMITAQNTMEEVNVLFGATALCYTNYPNYYMPGGLIELVNPLIAYLESKGGSVFLRTSVNAIQKIKQTDQKWNYRIDTGKNGIFHSEYLVSGIPLNNTLGLFDKKALKNSMSKVMDSSQLNSAFQMGIAFREHGKFPYQAIHHQIHLPQPLTGVGAHSIFISLNHPDDLSRSDEPGYRVASVSTHLKDPGGDKLIDKDAIQEYILDLLVSKNFFQKEDIVYLHSSTQKSWEKWTGRAFGFVGGYPQYMKIKPWQMHDARLDLDKAYICGDTVYPGQGIPGTALSGIIAYHKLKSDWGR